MRDASVKGGVVMFHQSFLLPFIKNMEAAFPFFNVSNQNHYPLNDKEQILFEQLFSVLLQESVNVSVVKPILLAFLEKSKLLYGTYGKEEQFLSKKSLLVRKFKNLISNHFIDKKEVSFYASQLTISANYLNEVVKSETGFSAKSHISNRVLLEAKNLLLYSEMDIAEISHVLQFSEPTHFTKFFKKGTGQTPKSFQNQKR
ncbi:MAG: AraC family transcriptional regulator [Bacteroidota bacterium]